ncbi:MAG: hypothetical protein CME88_00590 [Hirschia sp.]|nr:hypothetical protein [Hirschia sp.]MBF16858.1 hypothetical protein [Hirschia sp.]|tara:strand:- start:740 stop:1516 length:777 start_codon:yes stop_codon:yes gene_type:complete
MTPEQLAAEAMGQPINPGMMETGSFWIWGILVALTIAWTIKDRKLPLFGLVLIAATSSFWQEFFGDWGAYLAWNPAFDRLPLWGDMAFTTPVKPLFVPFSWGWWFAISIPLLVMLVRWLNRKFPRVSITAIAMLTAFPLFLAYQINVEGSSVANGWWTYDSIIGPTLESEKGRLPLVFPLLIGLWAGGFVALLAMRDSDGLMPHERRLGVAARPVGLQRELARVWAMVLVFQITFFVVNIAPPIIGRLIFGGPSALVP